MLKGFTKLIRRHRRELATKLHGFQLESIGFGLSRPAAGFFLAPGLGKTRIILTIFKILKKLGYVDELLVLANKKIVYNVWSQEIKKWKFPFTPVIVHGTRKRKALYDKTADVRLMNYEGLEWLCKQNRFFKRGKKLMLALDESSKVRHTTTVRFRSLKKILPFFCRRYIMTGSPAPNGLINLFGQVYALDLGETLGTYITEYRQKYFFPSGYMGYKWTLQPGAKKRIYKKIKPLIIRFGTDQIDMPPITIIDRKIKLSDAVQEVYDELEREKILEYDEGVIVAANAAVVTQKLRQIANGGVYYSPSTEEMLDETPGKKAPRTFRTMHDEKCADLVELLEELQGEPALVSFEFEHDKKRLQKYFAKHAPQFKDAPFIDGNSKEKDVANYLRQWDKGQLPVLFGNPDSVAHGLNLQGKGGIVIFFAMTWSLENYEQFIQRVWRQGQKRRVLVYRLLMRGTVDMDMVKAIRLKDHDQTTLLESMQRRVQKKIRRLAREGVAA